MRISALIVMMLLLLPSCGEERSSSFDIALSQEPPVLDVMLNSSISGRMIAVGNVYEKLLVLDADGNVRPELAESFSLSEDGHRLSFRLRSDVPFHNGDILTAEDAAASMNRWLDSVPAAKNASGGSYFIALDPVTLTIESSSNLSFLPVMMASSPQSAVIMPLECIDEAMDTGLVTEFIGTGPYEFSDWKTGEYIELKAFRDYKPYADTSSGLWGNKKGQEDVLRYYFVPDEVTRTIGFESGLYDAIDCVSSDDVQRLADSGASILQGGENGSIAIVFNKKEGVSTDRLFRQAVSLIVDRDTLMRSCYGDYGFSLHSDYMEKEQGIWLSASDDPYGYMDAEKGKAMLDLSSYDGSPVRILTSNLTNLDRIAVSLASCLESVGIDAEVSVMDWASFLEKRKDPSSWDIYVSAMSKVPLPQQKTYLSPDFPGWFSDEDILSDIAAMNSSSSIEEAAERWAEIQYSLWEYVPVMIPGHYSTIYAVAEGIDGVIAEDGFYFWNAE